MNKLKLVWQKEQQKIYEFKPSLFRLFYNNMEPITPQRVVRFLGELIKGYQVYYLEVDGALVAYCVISHGGGRYWFAQRDDIVVGPYFVDPAHRGHHYSEVLVDFSLHSSVVKYKDAYDWIRKDNYASLKCSQRAGFEVVGTANLVGPLRTIRKAEGNQGDYYILKYHG